MILTHLVNFYNKEAYWNCDDLLDAPDSTINHETIINGPFYITDMADCNGVSSILSLYFIMTEIENITLDFAIKDNVVFVDVNYETKKIN